MALVTVSKKRNRTYQRAFDHDLARTLKAQGWTYKRLADRFGVSVSAVNRVINPRVRANSQKHSLLSSRRRREPCLGGCGTLVWRHGTGPSGYCRTCSALLRATSVRPTTLRCGHCRTWKPDESFPIKTRAKARRGRHDFCRPCQTIVRRENRHANAERDRGIPATTNARGLPHEG